MDLKIMDNLSWSLFETTNVPVWQDAWENLHQQTGNHILLDMKCLKAALTHFPAQNAFTAIATAGEQIIAAGIFVRLSMGRWITYQPSQLPMGAWLNLYPEHVEALLTQLANKLPGLVLTISITQQDPNLFARPNSTAKLDTLDYITTGKMVLDTPFSEYWATRSKNTRQNLNKINNRLQSDQLTSEFKVVQAAEEFAAGVQLYGQIEQKSWKNAEGTAITENDVQSRFYIELLTSLGAAEAEIWRLDTAQGTVAADLCIKRDKTLIILKTTYLEDWAKYSPAFLMHVKGIEYCTNAALENIEFYGPAMEWHRKLTDNLRTMYHISYYHFSVLKTLKNELKNIKKNKDQ